MNDIDLVRILKRLAELREPGLNLPDPKTCALRFRQARGQRFTRVRIHRNRRPTFILDEIVNAQNVWMDELAGAFDFLPESIHGLGVAEERRRDKMEGNIFAENLIVGEPDAVFTGTADAPF